MFAAVVLLLPRGLVGQEPTGEELSERSLLPRTEIEQAMAESRFRLGPVYLSPVIAIRDATYDNNVFGTNENPRGDFRTTVQAGAGLILPVGKNAFLRAGAFPEYTWYEQLTERRFFGGKYGGSVRVFANRLTLDASGDYSKTDVLFSSEAQTRAIEEIYTFRLGAELRVLNRLFVYGEGDVKRYRYSEPGAPETVQGVSLTDRTERGFRGEVRYRWSEDVRLAAGYEQIQAEFVQPQQRDNVIRAVVGTVYYDRGKLLVKVAGGYSKEKPIHDSTIPPFSGFIGSGSVSYTLLRPLDLQAFAERGVTYGVGSPYYITYRYGAGVVIRTGWRVSMRGFGSLGTDSYSTPVAVPGGGLVDRRDDVKDYGGSLDFLFTSRIQARFAATKSLYNSNVPGNDRSFFRWSVSLLLGGNLLK
jgi:Putative beta-barrel porin 2